MNKCSLLQQRAAARWHHVIKHYSPGVKPLHTWHLNIKPDLTYDYQLNRLYRVIVNLIYSTFIYMKLPLTYNFGGEWDRAEIFINIVVYFLEKTKVEGER